MKEDRFFTGYDGEKLPTLRTMLRWLFYKKEDEPRMSQYGIRLPAPKLDLPDHLKSHEELLTWISRHREISANPTAKLALITYCLHWRIERSRADDLERMVEQLEMENRRLRKPRILSLFKRKQ